MSDNFNLIIRNGNVFDGNSKPPQKTDVGIKNDRITAIGDLSGATANREIDADGFAVAPGFIDVHTHSDNFVMLDPDAPSKITQGITTDISGQCGSSGAPLTGEPGITPIWTEYTFPSLSQWNIPAGTKGPTWRIVAEYHALLDHIRPALNIALFIGHNAIRRMVMKYEPRHANAEEVASMVRLLEQALDEGGSGFSTGLIYQPGKFAAHEEIVSLTKAAAARGHRYATHMRSESSKLIEAIDEVLDLMRTTGIAAQISHLKTSGESNWHLMETAIARIENARKEGLVVHADRYPYLASGTSLSIILPEWSSAGGNAVLMATLNDPEKRARLIYELDHNKPSDWNTVMIGGALNPEIRQLAGRTIAEIAADKGLTPGETMAWVLTADKGQTEAFFHGMCEKNLKLVYQQPWVMLGSDASLRSPTGPSGQSHPHPRAYGTFPRFLRFTQDQKLMSLEEAIRRCTSLPADTFGLTGRGRLQINAFADITIFDPVTICDKATYAKPHQFSEGIRQVIVNGKLCYDQGKFTGNHGGRFIQSARR